MPPETGAGVGDGGGGSSASQTAALPLPSLWLASICMSGRAAGLLRSLLVRTNPGGLPLVPGLASTTMKKPEPVGRT